MAYLTPVAWRCLYGNDEAEIILRASSQVRFYQSFTSSLSWAEHRLSVVPGLDGEETVQTALQKYVESGRVITFKFADVGEQRFGAEHSHIVQHYDMGNNLATQSDRNYITVTTVEPRILLSRVERCLVRRGGSAAEVWRSVVSQYPEINIDDTMVETAGFPAEFRVLRQANQTDHDFIMKKLIPRAVGREGKGGYQMTSADGRHVGFHSQAFNSREVALVPEEILRVQEGAAPFLPVWNGGDKLRMQGFDPDAKKLLQNEAAGVPVNLAKGKQLQTGDMQSWCAGRSPEAVAAFGRAMHDMQPWSHWFFVTVRGTDRLGINRDFDIKPNLILDLSGTKYREQGIRRGLVVAAEHEWREHHYTITFHCVRNSSDL